MNLPRCVHEKHGSYYLVKQNRWTRLCPVKDGLAGIYKALASLMTETEARDDRMPAVVAQWQTEIGAGHSKKARDNEAYMLREISNGFADFRAIDVRPSSVIKFLKQFRSMPRTHNGYRAMLRELMRFAEACDYRDPGTNPVDSVPTMTLKARSRYITDSELRRIKVGAIYAKPHPVTGHKFRNRSGLMLCALVDLAYLTGQRIGDLLTLKWSQVSQAGILFEPSKVEHSTGVKVLIEWTPKLRAVVARLKELKRADITAYMVTTQTGQPFTYSGASSAWKRAVKRAGVRGVTFHDLKAKALTDVDGERGIGEAQKMGGHSTQSQTADYVRHKTARKTGATR